MAPSSSWWWRGAALGLSWFLLASPPALALINPTFTPVHLVRQATSVLAAEAGAVDADSGRMVLSIRHKLKGDGPAEFAVDTVDSDPQVVREVVAEMDAGRRAAIIFMGEVGDPDAGESSAAVVKIGQIWCALEAGEDGVYTLAADTLDLKAVWAGGAEMLQAATRYILADPRADLPVEVGLTWKSAERIAEIDGAVHGLQVVEMGKPATPHLVVYTQAATRLFRRSEGEWAETTGSVGIEARAQTGVWADFTGDGHLDFLAVESGLLRLHYRGEDEKFAVKAVGADLPAAVAAVDAFVPGPGAPAQAVASLAGGGPVHMLGVAGEVQVSWLPWPDPPPDSESLAGVQVGDFTGDGVLDVAVAYADGIRLWAGKAEGGFAPPVHSSVNLGGAMTAFLAMDFSGHGRLDLLAATSRGPILLSNLGEGRFRDRSPEIGEPSYLARPHVKGAAVADLNHDGRPDFVLAYEGLGAHAYFNRGFRTFGYAIGLELRDAEMEATEGLADGQQAVAAGDFTGDGKPEVVMVDPDGVVWMLTTETEAAPVLSLTVALAERQAGPVVVTARDGEFNLGARLVQKGRPAVFGKTSRGPIEIRYRNSDGKETVRSVVVLRPTRIELGE